MGLLDELLSLKKKQLSEKRSVVSFRKLKLKKLRQSGSFLMAKQFQKRKRGKNSSQSKKRRSNHNVVS